MMLRYFALTFKFCLLYFLLWFWEYCRQNLIEREFNLGKFNDIFYRRHEPISLLSRDANQIFNYARQEHLYPY